MKFQKQIGQMSTNNKSTIACNAPACDDKFFSRNRFYEKLYLVTQYLNNLSHIIYFTYHFWLDRKSSPKFHSLCDLSNRPCFPSIFS